MAGAAVGHRDAALVGDPARRGGRLGHARPELRAQARSCGASGRSSGRGRAPLIVAPGLAVLPVEPRRDGRGGRARALGLCPALWPLFATLAVLMAASRVYLAVHHVSDVVAGLAVGACAGAAFALLAG